MPGSRWSTPRPPITIILFFTKWQVAPTRSTLLVSSTRNHWKDGRLRAYVSLKPLLRLKLAPPWMKILKEELSLYKVSASRR